MASNSILLDSLKGFITQGKILLPDSQGYEESLKRWSDLSVRRAAIIVKPANTNEVSAAVKFAVSAKLPLAVRCGGHSSKAASSSEGLVIDLSLMRSVDVDPVEMTATISGGCLIGDVNKATEPHNLAVVTGAESTVGYAGLTLGGGYGFLTGTHGLGCDNLLEVEVVLADGSIVTASETQNTDLFWALRGAGANFGVCTKFKSRLYPQGSAWAGFLVFTMDQLPGIVDFVNHMHQNHTGREGLLFGPCTPPPAFAPVIMALVFYNGSEEDGREYFRALLDLTPVADLTRYAGWSELNGMPEGPSGSRKVHGSANYVMPLKLGDVEDACRELLAFMKDKQLTELGSLMAWEFWPNDKIRAIEPSATAFAARHDSYPMATIFQWNDPAMDQDIEDFNDRFTAKLKKTGIGRGVQQYNNYNGNKLSPEELFGENLPRLQELKKKYDPSNVFSSWQRGFPSS